MEIGKLEVELSEQSMALAQKVIDLKKPFQEQLF